MAHPKIALITTEHVMRELDALKSQYEEGSDLAKTPEETAALVPLKMEVEALHRRAYSLILALTDDERAVLRKRANATKSEYSYFVEPYDDVIRLGEHCAAEDQHEELRNRARAWRSADGVQKAKAAILELDKIQTAVKEAEGTGSTELDRLQELRTENLRKVGWLLETLDHAQMTALREALRGERLPFYYPHQEPGLSRDEELMRGPLKYVQYDCEEQIRQDGIEATREQGRKLRGELEAREGTEVPRRVVR